MRDIGAPVHSVMANQARLNLLSILRLDRVTLVTYVVAGWHKLHLS
jgi:hypothetical protein